ncbi:MAG TPA: DegQ family serine endoprotease [Gammaproteobacteria bacterium]|nr:DegQ family serine endoprotease [Gammaproteobacteria bacterium]
MTEPWKRSTRFGWLAGAIGAAVLALSLVSFNDDSIAQSTAARVQSPGSFADVIEDVSPAVVNITVSKVETASPTVFQFPPGQFPPEMRGRESPFDDFFRFFGGENGRVPQRRSEGQGSGFIVDASGYIVTNNHVAGDAEEITVTLHDGRKFDATLVGRDARTDLALIKIDAGGLPSVAFGDSDTARVGDWVVAIGNPFGLGGTATAGIISARGRDVGLVDNDANDYLQLDAPINFGNSGGPVFNTAGQVVGVNTAIFSPNGGNVGIGFAIPANQVKEIVAELRENGSIERGWLGVQIQNIDEDLADSLGLDSTRGALVTEVVADSPAARGGVQAGDVVTRFNGQEVDSTRTLSRSVASAPPNQPARLTVWRDNRSRELTVELGELQESEAIASSVAPGQSGSGALGLTLQSLTGEARAQLGLPNSVQGALVTNVLPGSTAAEKGMRPGDVITRVNQRAVASVADAIAALNAAKENGENALLLVRRGDSQRFVALSFQ